jgi:hypothetical protein
VKGDVIAVIIANDGTIQSLTVREHLKFQELVYADDVIIRLTGDKHGTFELVEGKADYTYIDLFAITFGFKEPLQKREGRGRVKITYGCSRAVRDEILYLPKEEIIEIFSANNCIQEFCQYWSYPTRINSKYAFTCLLARYRAINNIAHKEGFTLEEVGRIYACTRERIRQIEEKALRRMRHKSRLEKFRVFKEKTLDYRDYQSGATTSPT